MAEVKSESIKKDSKALVENTETTEPVVVPTYRSMFDFSTERGVSERFLSGASLDIIQRLPQFCEEDFPQKEKSMAYLVPFSSNTNANNVILPTNRANTEEDVEGDARGTQARIVPGQTNPIDFRKSETNVEEKSAKELEEAAKVENQETNAEINNPPKEVGDTVEAVEFSQDIVQATVDAREAILNDVRENREAINTLNNSKNAQVTDYQRQISQLQAQIDSDFTDASDEAALQDKINNITTLQTNFLNTVSAQRATLVSKGEELEDALIAFDNNPTNKKILGLTVLRKGTTRTSNYETNLSNGKIIEESKYNEVLSEETPAVFSSIPDFSGSFNIPNPEGTTDFSDSPCGDYNFGAFVFLMNPTKLDINLSSNYSEAKYGALGCSSLNYCICLVAHLFL